MPDISTDLIFKLAEDFVQSRKNANNLAKMIEQLASKNEIDGKLKNCCILGLETMFSHSLSSKDCSGKSMYLFFLLVLFIICIIYLKIGSGDAAEEYRTWIFKKHEEALEILKSIVKNPKQPYPVREQAMVTYMHLLKLESLYINKPKGEEVFCLPKIKFLVSVFIPID